MKAGPQTPSSTGPGLWEGLIFLLAGSTGAEYSLEGLMRMLKLQYFGHLMRRSSLFEKTLMLGKTEQEKGMTEDEMIGCPSLT